MTSTIPAKLQRLIDHHEILDCIHRCARGMDRHDAELIASAYHPDAIDDHGAIAGAPAEFIAFVNGTGDEPGVHAELFVDHMHFLTNQTIEIDGATAHAETYYLMVGKYRGADRTGIWTGRYVDRLEKRDGEWRIAARQVVMGDATADIASAASAGAETMSAFARKTWDRTDVSYDRPLAVMGHR